MPKLRVLAGPNLDDLHPITANKSGTQYHVKTDKFEGDISVFLKDFIDAEGKQLKSDYFESTERHGYTWSIQAQGRFLKNVNADQVVFGNVFDRSLNLPYGSGVALKFLKHQDPTLEHDLQGDRPWALSPLVSTMPFLEHKTHPSSSPLPPFPTNPIHNDPPKSFDSSAPEGVDRRAYFSDAAHRQAINFTPDDVLTIDFCQGWLSFNPGLSLTFPMGLTFDLMRYWDGRNVCFVCCERAKDGPGEIYWCVVFEIVREEGVQPVAGSQKKQEKQEKGDEQIKDNSGDID